ncbi:MAG: hypothetical protein H0U63_01095 [Burkholderiales bacterium]|nr:hypothetical protein [Burkholderiales bacterium]
MAASIEARHERMTQEMRDEYLAELGRRPYPTAFAVEIESFIQAASKQDMEGSDWSRRVEAIASRHGAILD